MDKIRALVHACHARLGHPLRSHQIDEVVQSTSVVVWTRREMFRGESTEETWIYGIARIEILEALRRRRRASAIVASLRDEVSEEVAPAPDERCGTDLRRRVLDAVRDCGDTAATILRRRLVDGCSFRSIARRVNLSEPATKARFYRVLPRVRMRLASLWRSISAP